MRKNLAILSQVSTRTDLDEERFRKLMRYFVRTQHYRVNSDGLTLRQKMFIDYMADKLGWEQGHLSNFLLKYYNKEKVADLTKTEAIKAIESLKNVLRHHN